MMKKVMAIDGNSLLFKAYYATKFTNMMQTSSGVTTNAVYGFINILNRIKRDFNYDYIIVAFDAGSNTIRKQKYQAYKGTRSKPDAELIEQFPIVREYLKLAGIPNYEVEGYEADDIIGTISNMLSADMSLDIITSDKDLLQLVKDDVTVLLSKKGMSDYLEITPETMNLVWAIKPRQVVDLKAIMGDPSDNIPGVKGIGEKGALKLLAEFDSLDNIYAHVEEIKGAMKDKLIADKDQAYLSYKLATIIKDIKLPFTVEDLVVSTVDMAQLKDFYYRYEMKSLLAKMSDNIEVEDDFSFEIVKQPTAAMLAANSFIDLISLNEYYHKDNILGLAIINDTGNYFLAVEDFINNDDVLTFLSTVSKKGYDIKRNLLLAHWHGFKIAGFEDDAMISSYLINSNNSLVANALVGSNFNIRTMTNKELKKEKKETVITTKVKQAYYLNKLIPLNAPKLKTLALNDLYDLELKIALILSSMEQEGILLDKEELTNLQKDFNNNCATLEKAIKTYANEDVNINSPKQLGELLFEKLNLRVIKKTKQGYSTDIDVLNQLAADHPIIPMLINYRSVKKILSTYIEPMFDYILSDGRVHTIYNQCLTQTGRLSSRDPNLQNIAAKSETQRVVKKMFVSKEGYSLISFDYSQIELRILASFADDPVFIKAFADEYDIHKDTASKVNGIAYDEVSPEQRKAAKAINFGIIYGMSDYGLGKSLGINRNSAHDFIKKYYETYPNIKNYLDKQVQSVMELGYSKTILNRIRYIDEINSNNHNIKEMGKRMALNTPIQGSAADILKLAMRDIDAYLKEHELDAKMLLQVHDELIFEVNDAIIDSFAQDIVRIMTTAYQLKVKLEVHFSSGKNWYDL